MTSASPQDVLGIQVTKQCVVDETDSIAIEGLVFLGKCDDSEVARLSVSVLGCECTIVKRPAANLRQLQQHRIFLHRLFTIVEFDGGQVEVGQYVYGFSLSLLRRELPPSIAFRDDRRCTIEYDLVAQLHRGARQDGQDVCARVPLVWYEPSSALCNSPPASTTCIQERKRFGCISKGTVSLSISLASSALSPDEPVPIHFEVHNESDTRIHGLEVVFHELLTWHAKGQTEVTERAHASSFSTDDLVPKRRDPDEVFVDVALLDGADRKYESQGALSLMVPGDFRPSFEGALIRCRHAITVSVMGHRGHADTVRIAIWIQHPARGHRGRMPPQRQKLHVHRPHMDDIRECTAVDLPLGCWQARKLCESFVGCAAHDERLLKNQVEQALSFNHAGERRQAPCPTIVLRLCYAAGICCLLNGSIIMTMVGSWGVFVMIAGAVVISLTCLYQRYQALQSELSHVRYVMADSFLRGQVSTRM